MLEIKDTQINLSNGKYLNIDNFQLKKGEIVGIVGNNGVGKTTFLETILGLKQNYVGSLKIENCHPVNYKKPIGYMPQNISINCPDVIVDSIMINAYNPWSIMWENNKKTIKKALNTAQASEYQYLTFNKLSGGQKKRVILALSLLNNPSIILLDEPFANIDKDSCLKISKSIKNIVAKRDVGVLVVSHEIGLINCDRLYHFRHQNVHECYKPYF